MAKQTQEPETRDDEKRGESKQVRIADDLAEMIAWIVRIEGGTALVAGGVPLGDVAKYLGDSVQVVVRTYTHASGTDPADTIEGVLGSRKVGNERQDTQKGRYSKRNRG